MGVSRHVNSGIGVLICIRMRDEMKMKKWPYVIPKIFVLLLCAVFFTLGVKWAEAASLPIYDGNAQNIISAIQNRIYIWKISTIRIGNRISGYRMYFGPQQKFTHQNNRNSVYIHLLRDNRVEYATVYAISDNDSNKILGTIIDVIAPDFKEVTVLQNITPSKTVEYPWGYFWSKRQNRRFVLYDAKKDKTNCSVNKIAADDGENQINFGNNRLPYEWEKENCVTCGGTGRCDNCGGSGQESAWDGARSHIVNCHRCGGMGTCWNCGGSGKR